MHKQYRKLVSGCPICGKLYCKFYGYRRSDKKWLKRKLKARIKNSCNLELSEDINENFRTN